MNLRKYLSNMKDYDADDVLEVMGLQKRSSGDWVFPMMAGLGAGMAIGAGLALFLTPYKGTEAREKFMKGAADAQKMLNQQVGSLSEKVTMLTEKMGIVKCGQAAFETLDKSRLQRLRKNAFGVEALTDDRAFYAERYPELMTQPATTEEIMLFYVRGEKL
jgi:gas vesicle protein